VSKPKSESAIATAPAAGSNKMSYKETRELQSLPQQIDTLEQEQAELTARMSSPDYHRQGAAQIKVDRLRAASIEQELTVKFERWAALESKSSAAPKQ
jgi:ATP-binding cassette subfamily F protein uup